MQFAYVLKDVLGVPSPFLCK